MMKEDAHSLANLHDIVIPDAPPFWPPAPGMWLLGALILSLLLILSVLIYHHWQRNAYRRAGLLLLQTAKSHYQLSVALKRVALAAFPREEVASLYGEDWAAFLCKTCPEESFERLALVDGSDSVDAQVMQLAGIWIRGHQPKLWQVDKGG